MESESAMDDASRRALVERIHATPTMLVLAVTGGGVAAVAELLNVPGASRTVLEVVVPYAETALMGLAGPLDHGAVSAATAGAMATACLARARLLAPDHPRLVGVACTAALVTDRPRRGDHRAQLAVAYTASGTDQVDHLRFDLVKGRLDRAGEDRLVADRLLQWIASASGVVAALG
jgi:hypothetical protein